MDYYYQYAVGLTRFIGKNPLQIILTIMHYDERDVIKIKYPRDSDFEKLEHITISCSLPHFKPEHTFRAELTDKLTLMVNANACFDVQTQFLEYKNLLRGSLYKFNPQPGFSMNGLVFLPEEVIKAGREYDWDRHLRGMGGWLGQREASLNILAQKKYFCRQPELRQ